MIICTLFHLQAWRENVRSSHMKFVTSILCSSNTTTLSFETPDRQQLDLKRIPDSEQPSDPHQKINLIFLIFIFIVGSTGSTKKIISPLFMRVS